MVVSIEQHLLMAEKAVREFDNDLAVFILRDLPESEPYREMLWDAWKQKDATGPEVMDIIKGIRESLV
ncbi:MAG: hypothetical protein Q7K41_00660 [Dehalococcoidales bacterium]|nr:hypothetical protein [Dehalococcoidales bacterium]